MKIRGSLDALGARRVALLGIFVPLIFLLPTDGLAEPITAVYNVEVLFRYSYSTEQYELYPRSFPLQLTFDPATSDREGSYGEPTFSRVLLPIPEPPIGAPLYTSKSTSHHSELESNNVTYRQYAGAEELTSTTPNSYQGEFVNGLLLESYFTDLPSRSIINAATFPVHLGMAGSVNLNGYGNFLFWGFRYSRDGLYTSDSFAYYGDARLARVDVSPVPEPGTWLLVATGLGAVMRRMRQNRQE